MPMNTTIRFTDAAWIPLEIGVGNVFSMEVGNGDLMIFASEGDVQPSIEMVGLKIFAETLIVSAKIDDLLPASGSAAILYVRAARNDVTAFVNFA